MSAGPQGNAPDAGNVRERILDEAAVLFVEHGYHGLSMRQIAEAVGVSKAGLYYHFADKEALFLAILLRNIERVGELVDDARAAGGSARVQVSRLLRNIVGGMAGSKGIIRLAESDAGNLGPPARERMHRAYIERFVGQVQAVLREGVESGELRELDLHRVTWLLLGMAFSGLSAPPERADAVVELMVGVFFDGVTRR